MSDMAKSTSIVGLCLALVATLAVCSTCLASIVPCGNVDLLAGRTIYAGKVFVSVQGGTGGAPRVLQIRITTSPNAGPQPALDWAIDKTQVYVGTSAPTKAVPGQFPYKHAAPSVGPRNDIYQIPLDTFSGTLYIAVHADVHAGAQVAGAWGAGTRIFQPSSNWRRTGP